MRNLEGDVPEEVVKYVLSPLLDLKSHAALAATCGVFREYLQLNLIERGAEKLLRHVDLNEEEQVKKILLSKPELLFIQISFTDHCGRKFEKVSPWQLMLWSLDTCMWDMAFSIVGKKSFEYAFSALQQKLEMGDKKLTYQLEGKSFRESHFNFTPTLAAYNAYIDKFDENSVSPDALGKLWCREKNSVGVCQQHWPMWMLRAICAPSFTFRWAERRKPLKHMERTATGFQKKELVLFSSLLLPGQGFGFSFVLIRAGRYGAFKKGIPNEEVVQDEEKLQMARMPALMDEYSISSARKLFLQKFDQLTSSLTTNTSVFLEKMEMRPSP